MNEFQVSLCEHLGRYRQISLGISQMGTWANNGKEYPHILPDGLELMNLLGAIRSEMQHYLAERPEIKLHKDFRHLNSSQAFAFNLFYPYFCAGGYAARALSSALGIEANVSMWELEEVQHEGTNVDVVWKTEDCRKVYCEVKFSEAEFGVAANDERHRRKYLDIYLPRLHGALASELLEEQTFRKHYQLLRNLSLIAQDDSSHLVVLLPRGNVSLFPQLGKFMAGLLPDIQHRVHVAYVEDVILRLENDSLLSAELVVHAKNLREKYLPMTAF